MRRLGGAAAAATATVLLLGGCGSQVPAPAPTPSVTVVTDSPSASVPAPSPPSSPSAAPSVSPGGGGPGRPAGQCADDDLGVLVERADDGGAAGSAYYQVLFTNTGGSSCVLRGAPEVSVRRGAGGAEEAGPPADRVESGVRSVRLGVGESAAAALRIVNIGDDGGPLDGCRVVRGTGYRVTAPNSARAVFVERDDARACADGPVFMTVSPVARFAG